MSRAGAVNLEGERVSEEWLPQKRKRLILEILQSLNIIP